MMNLFGNDTFLGRFFGRIGDIIVLNILFVVCSLPVFTMGASFCALSYAFLEKEKGSDTPNTTLFFSAFRSNFKQATPLWLLFLAMEFILITDYRFFDSGALVQIPFFPYLFLLAGVILMLVAIWLFPVIASFRNTWKALLGQAFFFATKNLPWTILLAGLWIFAVYLTFSSINYLLFAVSFWIIFGFALLVRIQAPIMWKAFRPYQPEENLPDEQEH